MQEITVCPVCGGEKFTHILNCTDYTVSHETFNIINCNICDLKITSPCPEDKDIGKYYLSENYISHANHAQSVIDKVYLNARKYTLKEKLKIISSYKKTPGKILDFGCGTGEFLNTCKKNGWDIIGVEPSLNAREKATELTYEKILDSLDKVTDTNFDIVTLWHVLEHVSSLNETLSKLHKTLKKDGTLCIAVPNNKSNDAQHYTSYWAGYDVPRHLWHFSPENMKKLLENNSFKLVKIIPMKLDAFYISLLSEKYKLKGKTTLSSIIKAMYQGSLSNYKGRETGNYSSLIYIAQK